MSQSKRRFHPHATSKEEAYFYWLEQKLLAERRRMSRCRVVPIPTSNSLPAQRSRKKAA